ncbi:hypothetical protein AVEN_134285-1 [Araneus ventricosus]|uniref:Pre-C2HC domain-containing protein n=1 Tax=Araneus ventricosus TaxID=182803 RepID=A0A4Y2L2M6_ARAVE|nr:hypothetical protein AVEN_134285-1 [Araneus ventricosus]
MEQGRGGAPSPLPPQFIQSIEISDDEPTRCQQLRAFAEKCYHYREKIKCARFLMNSEPNDPLLPTLAQMKKAYGISLSALEKRDLKKINDEWGPVESKLGGSYIKLFTQSDEASNSLTKFLGTNDMGYFIIVPRSERPIKVVIRGLPRDLNVDVLKKALVEEYEFVVDKVAQLTRFKTKEPLELFQVTLPNIEVNKGIWKVTSLLYLKIKVVKFELKTGSIQCFNCNYWHHSTATCGFKPRCIKCGGQHVKECDGFRRMNALILLKPSHA